MVRPLLVLVPLLLAGCGGREDDAVAQANSVEELENRLEKLADRTTEDIEPPSRLAELEPADFGAELSAEPACRLHRDGRPILIANESGAVARIDGRRVKLTVAGPVGPTGGFFTAPGVTVSVGRIGPFVDEAKSYARGWPARLSIGGDPERPIEKHEATWICTR